MICATENLRKLKMKLKSLKNNTIALLFSFMLAGCVTETPVLNGVDGTPLPSAFANFPDIPFPAEAFLELGDTKTLGSGENWVGSLVFTAPYNASRLFDFYISEMPKNRWAEVAVVRARISQMTYFRDNRAIQILIESLKETESRVSLTAIPNQTTLR